MGETENPRLGWECPACRSRVSRYLGRKEFFDVFSCEACRTTYTSRNSGSPEAQNYDAYYTAESLAVPDFIRRRLDEIVAGFSGYRLHNRLLEVGFGAGSLLNAAARAGWVVEGVEVSKSAIKHGDAQGFKTFRGELAQGGYEAESFDLVIATELLEHLPEPRAMVREIARILRPGGLFWGTTPNSRGLSPRLLGLKWSVLAPPEHLHLLSENGVRNLFVEAGFRKVRIDTEGTNPYEWVNLRGRKKKSGPLPASYLPRVRGCDRVNAGYHLNEVLMKSRSRRTVKNLLNSLLRLSHLGDSLKIRAER